MLAPVIDPQKTVISLTSGMRKHSSRPVAWRLSAAADGRPVVVDDGRIDAHNNTAERALRGVAIGRKNYLHVGSDAGGHTAAVMYTLLGTAKLNGINPQRYLRHVLERIADHPSNRIDELLPWVIAAKWADETIAKDMPLFLNIARSFCISPMVAT